MSIDLSHISTLSLLSLDAVSYKKIEKDLSEILSLVDKMNVVDTQNIEPMTHPHDGFQRLRDDVVSEEIDLNETQKSAPKTDQGYYLVPKVIE
tara:strand:+ start:112 stop:390 length:279 start_codon:yes stop_codon:yes gene_type:complete